jgi:general secretion pathway protein A
MYTSFFGLNEKPFAITPDPRYLFMSERHGEALAHLVYGVTESGGFMQLTGEVGTGKTTLVRTLLQNKLPKNADVAVVLNPRLSVVEFLETICEELGILAPEFRGSVKALVDALNKQLLKAHAEGRRVILVVDEAQNLSRDVLEQVRLLTNLETAKQKLLQIILIGQPELRDLLAREDLRQLAQRITGRYHLEPLRQCGQARGLPADRGRAATDQRHLRPSPAGRVQQGNPARQPAPGPPGRRRNQGDSVHGPVAAMGGTGCRRGRRRRHRYHPVAVTRGTRRPGILCVGTQRCRTGE